MLSYAQTNACSEYVDFPNGYGCRPLLCHGRLHKDFPLRISQISRHI